jgi:hypothetical protein
MSRIRFIALALLACTASLAACVDSPTEATSPLTQSADNQLAQSFESLAAEQSSEGDVERAEEFKWAALAVRAGVQASRYEVDNNGTKEVFSAFVHAAHWVTPTLALRPIGHRTFIAWRKESEVMKVIIIETFNESAPIQHPYSLRPAQPGGILASPLAAATGAYFEHGSSRKAFWIGVSGQVKIGEQSSGGACRAPNDQAPPSGVSCELARYAVSFDMTSALTITGTRTLAVAAQTRKTSGAPQPVGGVKLTFNCVSPTSDRGCG